MITAAPGTAASLGQPDEQGSAPTPAVFAEPWQAQAFAMTLALHRRGLFGWPEWAAALTAEITAAQERGDPDHGDTYYHHWLAALEGMVARKGVATRPEVDRYANAWGHAARRTPHGAPIMLAATDFGGSPSAEAPPT